MARHNYGTSQAFKVAADFSAKQNYFVKISAAETVAICGAGEAAIGVNLENPDTIGDTTGVMCEGGSIVEVVAGAIVAAGAPLASDSTGRAILAVDPAYVLGTALEAATAADDIISVLFNPQGKTILDTTE